MSKPEFYQTGIRHVSFGARVRVVEPCNLYGCTIGDDCFVGPFTEIQKGAVIGARFASTVARPHLRACDHRRGLLCWTWRDVHQRGRRPGAREQGAVA